jgi:hypothetical protein
VNGDHAPPAAMAGGFFAGTAWRRRAVARLPGYSGVRRLAVEAVTGLPRSASRPQTQNNKNLIQKNKNLL